MPALLETFVRTKMLRVPGVNAFASPDSMPTKMSVVSEVTHCLSLLHFSNLASCVSQRWKVNWMLPACLVINVHHAMLNVMTLKYASVLKATLWKMAPAVSFYFNFLILYSSSSVWIYLYPLASQIPRFHLSMTAVKATFAQMTMLSVKMAAVSVAKVTTRMGISVVSIGGIIPIFWRE